MLNILNVSDRLRTLREKLKQQRQHLDELDAHMYVPIFVSIFPTRNPVLLCIFKAPSSISMYICISDHYEFLLQ